MNILYPSKLYQHRRTEIISKDQRVTEEGDCKESQRSAVSYLDRGVGGGQCQAYDTQCDHCAPGGSQEKHYEDTHRERERETKGEGDNQ